MGEYNYLGLKGWAMHWPLKKKQEGFNKILQTNRREKECILPLRILGLLQSSRQSPIGGRPFLIIPSCLCLPCSPNLIFILHIYVNTLPPLVILEARFGASRAQHNAWHIKISYEITVMAQGGFLFRCTLAGSRILNWGIYTSFTNLYLKFTIS